VQCSRAWAAPGCQPVRGSSRGPGSLRTASSRTVHIRSSRSYWAGALALFVPGGSRNTRRRFRAAAPVIAVYALTPDRITVIPLEIDMAVIRPRYRDRAAGRGIAQDLEIPYDALILLVPGRVALGLVS